MSEGRLRAILDKGAFFKGELRFQGTVRIGGEFEGEVDSPEGCLIVESTASVRGVFKVRELILNGKLEGDVHAVEQVHMYPPAHFIGQVWSPSLKVEEGVIFEGTSFHAKSQMG